MLTKVKLLGTIRVIDKIEVKSRYLQHAGTCEVQREIHQAANISQRTANLTTFLTVLKVKEEEVMLELILLVSGHFYLIRLYCPKH